MQQRKKDDRGLLGRMNIALTQEQYDRIKKMNDEVAALLSGTKTTPPDTE